MGTAHSAARQSCEDPVPASRKEQALWTLESLVPGSGVNNLTMAFSVCESLDSYVLQQVVDQIIRRREILRTVFRNDDTGALVRSVLDADLVTVEITELVDTDAAGDEVTTWVAEPFRSDGTLLLRAGHIVRPNDDVFCLVVHHSIFDGMSTPILLREFVELYNSINKLGWVSAEPGTPEEPWEEPLPKRDSEQFWLTQLDGFTGNELKLACEHPDPPKVTLSGEVVERDFGLDHKEGVHQLHRELRAPEAVVLLSAYYVLLAMHDAGPDLTVGAPVSLRDHGSANAVGYHINVLTLRQFVDPSKTFRELVSSVRKTFLEAMAHRDYPIDRLLEKVPRVDSSWRNILFRHLFNYAPIEASEDLLINGKPASMVTLDSGFSKFDLELFVGARSDGFELRAIYCTDVFNRVDVELLLDRYETLLCHLRANVDRPIGEVQFWSKTDGERIEASNRTSYPIGFDSTLDMVAASISRAPDGVAIEHGRRSITYSQLWAASADMCNRLIKAGVGQGSCVALIARRSAELVATVLGTWLAGAVYLPLDPDHPEKRLSYVLENSGAAVVVADREITPVTGDLTVLRTPGFGNDFARSVEPAPISADDPAYLIYTSGSTGNPKGTVVTHRSLVNLIEHFARDLDSCPGEPTVWLTTFSFDISALELFLPLSTGGTIVIAPDAARTDGKVLCDLLAGRSGGVVQATPTTWRMVLDDVVRELPEWRVLCGGEPLPLSLARRLAACGRRVVNVYGPTETTIWSASAVLDAASDRVDIGTPIANTQIFVEGQYGQELPIGVRGELCIAGVGLALQYHAQPELTAQRFGFSSKYGRYYRTGDSARWLVDGRLEVFGRTDRQIKLHGNRIELGEVEAVLAEYPGVSTVAVVPIEQPSSATGLVAFVVTRNPDIAGLLWEHSRAFLPRAAVPQTYLRLSSLPMTGNDKVDYQILTRMASENADIANRADPPGAQDEPVGSPLIQLWRELLGSDHVNSNTNFFLSGGNSLIGSVLLQRVETRFGIRLALADLFENPTPEMLMVRLRRDDKCSHR